MAEDFSGGAAERGWQALRRLRILFGVALILFGVLAFTEEPGDLFGVFLFLAVAFVCLDVATLLSRAPLRKHVELVSMLLAASAIGWLIMATGGVEGPFLPLLVAPVFMHGLGSGGVGVTAAAISSITVAAVLSAVAVFGGAAARALVGPAAVVAVAWLGARAADASVMVAKNEGEELLRLAQRDPLTGVLNRRSLYQLVERLTAQKKEFAIVLVDLDGFKRVNDEHGHLVGDRVLQRVAEAMEKAVRREDAVARYGGDEFAVLVQGGRESGEQVLERLREAVELVAREVGVATSLSGGVAAWPEDGATLEELLDAADRMLYRAKRNGKDGLCEARVCSS